MLEEEESGGQGTIGHAAMSVAKYALLFVCVSALWAHFHRPVEVIVPAYVKPTGQEQTDRVKQSLLKLGAPPEKIEDLTRAVRSASALAQVSPILLVALMYTENESFDYTAVSEKGYKGLMQTPWASMRWADVDTLLGARILREKLEISGNDLLEALRLYKGGRNPTATRQAKRTMAVYEELLKQEGMQ